MGPAHHKWCDIYQESLVAGRNYFRHVVAIFILVVAYQSYTMGMPLWAAIMGAVITWMMVRLGGRIVQSRHYERAESQWEQDNPNVVASEEDSHANDQTASHGEGQQD